jgi:hypothetical protein
MIVAFAALGAGGCAGDDAGSGDEADLTQVARTFHMNPGVERGRLANCAATDRACYLKPDFENAEWLAEFSKQVYLDDVDDAHPEKSAGFRDALKKIGIKPTEFVLFDHSLLGSHAAYFEMGDTAVLVFRGTRTDRWQDLVGDAKLKKTNGIHSGFLELLNGIWNGTDYLPSMEGDIEVRADLGDFLTQRFSGATKPKAFYITGHSLGGALATLALHRMLTTKMAIPEKTAEYTFGTPRSGDATYASALWSLTRAANIPYYRFVHRVDIVPMVPPTGFGFSHIGSSLAADSEDGLDSFIHLAESSSGKAAPDIAFGARVPNPKHLGTGVGDHSMATYASLLHAYAAKVAPQ